MQTKHNGHLTALSLLSALLLSGLLPGVASGGLCGIKQPCPTGTTVSSAANYGALPACSTGGAIGYTEDADLYWVCNSATGLWLPPNVQPASIDIVDYTAAALPADSTPAWSTGGTASQSVAGGELTIDNSAGSWRNYYLSDADIATTNNVGMLVRVKVTSTNGSYNNWKAFACIRPGSDAYQACMSFDGGNIGGLGNVAAVGPYPSQGGTAYVEDGPDNQVYRWYLITYTEYDHFFSYYSLGGSQSGRIQRKWSDSTYSPGASTVFWGCYDPGIATSVWDRVMVFTF